MTKAKTVAAFTLVLVLAVLAVFGGMAVAQTVGVGQIPLMGKLVDGTPDDGVGIADAQDIDFDPGAALPAPTGTYSTVWHELDGLIAGDGTRYSAGSSFPTSGLNTATSSCLTLTMMAYPPRTTTGPRT